MRLVNLLDNVLRESSIHKFKTIVKSNPNLISKGSVANATLVLLPLLSSSRSVKSTVPNHKETLHSFWAKAMKFLGSSMINIKEYDIDVSRLSEKEIGELSASTIDIITSRLILDILEKGVLQDVSVDNKKMGKVISYIVKDITNLDEIDDQAIQSYIDALRSGKNTFDYGGIQYNMYLEDSPIQIAKEELSKKASNHKKVGEMMDELERFIK